MFSILNYITSLKYFKDFKNYIYKIKHIIFTESPYAKGYKKLNIFRHRLFIWPRLSLFFCFYTAMNIWLRLDDAVRHGWDAVGFKWFFMIVLNAFFYWEWARFGKHYTSRRVDRWLHRARIRHDLSEMREILKFWREVVYLFEFYEFWEPLGYKDMGRQLKSKNKRGIKKTKVCRLIKTSRNDWFLRYRARSFRWCISVQSANYWFWHDYLGWKLSSPHWCMRKFGPITGFNEMVWYSLDKEDFAKHYEPLLFDKTRVNNPDPNGYRLPFYICNIRRTTLPALDKSWSQYPVGTDWIYLFILDLIKYLKKGLFIVIKYLRRFYYRHIWRCYKNFQNWIQALFYKN